MVEGRNEGGTRSQDLRDHPQEGQERARGPLRKGVMSALPPRVTATAPASAAFTTYQMGAGSARGSQAKTARKVRQSAWSWNPSDGLSADKASGETIGPQHPRAANAAPEE